MEIAIYDWIVIRSALKVALGSNNILHYQKIILALKETGRLMGEIDLIKIE